MNPFCAGYCFDPNVKPEAAFSLELKHDVQPVTCTKFNHSDRPIYLCSDCRARWEVERKERIEVKRKERIEEIINLAGYGKLIDGFEACRDLQKLGATIEDKARLDARLEYLL